MLMLILGVLIGYALGQLYYYLRRRKIKPVVAAGPPARPTILYVESWSRIEGDYVLNVKYTDGKVVAYRGNRTVWRHYPSGERCDTSLEVWLSNLQTSIQWAQM